MAWWVERPTFDFGSGHGLGVVRLSCTLYWKITIQPEKKPSPAIHAVFTMEYEQKCCVSFQVEAFTIGPWAFPFFLPPHWLDAEDEGALGHRLTNYGL